VASQVHGYIQNRTDDGADQLALRLPHLIVQPAERIANRKGMIVLYELFVNTRPANVCRL